MIFASAKGKIFKRRLKKQLSQGVPYWEISRRATSLLPSPQAATDVLLKGTYITGYSNLLLSLEANQKSGCLIIQSDKTKSRSGTLIFKGRILGCMYGQKNLKNYLFENHAFERALRDLQSSKKTVDVYQLKDEIVIAAAALFHGPTFEEPDMPAIKFFDEVYRQLVESNVPGCVVMRDKNDESTYVVYIFAGQIVGIHYSKKGWMQPDLPSVYKYLNQNPHQRMQACILPCQNEVEVNKYSFSLSGLADRDFSKVIATDKYDCLNIFYMLSMDKERLAHYEEHPDIIHMERFFPNVSQTHYKFLSRLGNIGNFAVHP